MPLYTVRTFERELSIADDEELAAVEMTPAGTSPTRNQTNLALVGVPDSAVEGEEGGGHVCGAETAGGTCGRSVDSPSDRCWQHD